jgi:hypothetical protein
MVLSAIASVDAQGTLGVRETLDLTFAAAGGTDPTISGWVNGTITVAAGDLLMAHATDPFQGMGDSSYGPPGFTVASTKLKLLYMKNLHATISINVIRGAANGLPVFTAAGDGIDIPAGGALLIYYPTGTAALTTTSNDKLTLAPASGSPTMDVLAIYGP